MKANLERDGSVVAQSVFILDACNIFKGCLEKVLLAPPSPALRGKAQQTEGSSCRCPLSPRFPCREGWAGMRFPLRQQLTGSTM